MATHLPWGCGDICFGTEGCLLSRGEATPAGDDEENIFSVHCPHSLDLLEIRCVTLKRPNCSAIAVVSWHHDCTCWREGLRGSLYSPPGSSALCPSWGTFWRLGRSDVYWSLGSRFRRGDQPWQGSTEAATVRNTKKLLINTSEKKTLELQFTEA
jgi:hypothetical protein